MGKIDYIKAYVAGARQLATYQYAGQWLRMDVPVRDAIAWADLGYMPDEAATLIADGITPQMAATGEDIAVEVAGGPEEHAAQRIDDLVADGVLVDPHRVRQEQDPQDPTHIIVHIDPA